MLILSTGGGRPCKKKIVGIKLNTLRMGRIKKQTLPHNREYHEHKIEHPLARNIRKNIGSIIKKYLAYYNIIYISNFHFL